MKATMSLSYINSLLATLPANVEVTLRSRSFRNRLLTRDMPGPDRRLTSLDYGSEWFLPINEEHGHALISVEIPAMTLEVSP